MKLIMRTEEKKVRGKEEERGRERGKGKKRVIKSRGWDGSVVYTKDEMVTASASFSAAAMSRRQWLAM